MEKPSIFSIMVYTFLMFMLCFGFAQLRFEREGAGDRNRLAKTYAGKNFNVAAILAARGHIAFFKALCGSYKNCRL